MLQIPCVIFAGGKSSRMGEDKALLPFGEYSTLSEYQYRKLSKIFSQVYISCKSSSKFPFEANFIEDNDATFSPTAAFVAIYEQLQTPRFFALSVDTPFITETIFTTLCEADEKSYDATVALIDGKMQPLCGIYHRSLYKEFVWMQHNNLHKLSLLLEQSNTQTIPFNDQKAFLNLNKKEHYTLALEIINSALL